MRQARGLIGAFVESQSLGDAYWQGLAQEMGDRFRFQAIVGVGAVAASAVLDWGAASGRPPRELLRHFAVQTKDAPPAAFGQTQMCLAVLHELIRVPRDQEALDRVVKDLGEREGVYALGGMAGLAALALTEYGNLVGKMTSQVLQEAALKDEQDLFNKGEG